MGGIACAETGPNAHHTRCPPIDDDADQHSAAVDRCASWVINGVLAIANWKTTNDFSPLSSPFIHSHWSFAAGKTHTLLNVFVVFC